MKLTEYKTETQHYFLDEQGRFQCEYQSWHGNGRRWLRCHHQDGLIHGEFKRWDWSGELVTHTFDVNSEEIIDFIKNPEQYPSTPEERTYFALKYGTAPFIGENE